jgi:hypothetical protein
VPLQVIANTGGTYTIQVANVTPNTTYTIEVAPAGTSGAHITGNFFLAVNFHQQQLASFANLDTGALSQASSVVTASLTAGQNQLMYFALSADGAGSNSGESVTMQIVNSSGQTVLSLAVGAGQPTATADVYLAAGNYTVRYSASSTSSSPFQPLNFLLTGDTLSDPVGAYSTNGNTSSSSPYTYSGSGSSSSTTSASSHPYYY